MKNKYLISCLLFSLVVMACEQSKQTNAYIFERHHLPGNKLLIKYRFATADTLIADSAIIEHVALNNDSIEVRYNTKNPEKSFVRLEK